MTNTGSGELRQFAVFENPSASSRRYAPYLAVIHSHHLVGLDYVVLAPVVNDLNRKITGIDVPVEIDSQSLVLAVSELASVPKAILKKKVGSLEAYADEISTAMNRLFVGF